MHPSQVVIAVTIAGALIVFGLVPGLLQRLVEAIRNFEDAVLMGLPPRPVRYEEPQRPIWLAATGALSIVLLVLAYAFN